jgi:Xaa-Pro aminopeptidase
MDRSLMRGHAMADHGIGLEGYEQPFIDMGDETELRPGMVLSVEPGLYVPGFAGFRHSDTVVITNRAMTPSPSIRATWTV